jgi:Cu+-exporting ATPase
VACPCALALAVPFTYGHTLRVFGKKGFYLKNANVIEKIAKIRSLVFDKTGTLTKPLPEKVEFVGLSFTDQEKCLIYSTVFNSVHPLSKILAQHLQCNERHAPDLFEEYPGKGICATFKNDVVKLGSAQWLDVNVNREDWRSSRVYVAINGTVYGYFQFSNQYRPGVEEMLHQLKRSYPLHLISGDHDGERKVLEPFFQHLLFRQNPEDKLRYLKALEVDNAEAMMVGDGLNDAGALKKSKVGISISDDIFQFSPASDGILDGNHLPRFASFLKFSRTALNIVYLAFTISFLYNLVGLSFAFTGQLTPLVSSILVPISSVSVVGMITLAINYKSRRLLK